MVRKLFYAIFFAQPIDGRFFCRSEVLFTEQGFYGVNVPLHVVEPVWILCFLEVPKLILFSKLVFQLVQPVLVSIENPSFFHNRLLFFCYPVSEPIYYVAIVLHLS